MLFLISCVADFCYFILQFLLVAVIIGKGGVEKIEEINLDEKEKKEFENSINAVKKLWQSASAIDPNLSE